MTKQHIDRIVTQNGIYKGEILHRMKVNGVTVGLDFLRYQSGAKVRTNKLKTIYQANS